MTTHRGRVALPEPWERELRRMEVLARLETARAARRGTVARAVRMPTRRLTPR
ncbi:hypothetical protein ACFT5B_01405 [Luteimicrobium sp. NPDC057192]|uniref:hypothetical protein n=1 Tax=Luteimicrobium sp. NPDC057192 TaxID=3346042 RepID=UPI00363CB88B